MLVTHELGLLRRSRARFLLLWLMIGVPVRCGPLGRFHFGVCQRYLKRKTEHLSQKETINLVMSSLWTLYLKCEYHTFRHWLNAFNVEEVPALGGLHCSGYVLENGGKYVIALQFSLQPQRTLPRGEIDGLLS